MICVCPPICSVENDASRGNSLLFFLTPVISIVSLIMRPALILLKKRTSCSVCSAPPITLRISFPFISFSEYPNIFSAAGFQCVTHLFSFNTTIPSFITDAKFANFNSFSPSLLFSSSKSNNCLSSFFIKYSL